MKSSIFWDITSCSPLKFSRCLGRTCRLYLQGRRIRQAIIQHEAGSRRQHFPPERRFTFNGLQLYMPEDRTLHRHMTHTSMLDIFHRLLYLFIFVFFKIQYSRRQFCFLDQLIPLLHTVRRVSFSPCCTFNTTVILDVQNERLQKLAC
jgi:hypothetical protein